MQSKNAFEMEFKRIRADKKNHKSSQIGPHLAASTAIFQRINPFWPLNKRMVKKSDRDSFMALLVRLFIGFAVDTDPILSGRGLWPIGGSIPSHFIDGIVFI